MKNNESILIFWQVMVTRVDGYQPAYLDQFLSVDGKDVEKGDDSTFLPSEELAKQLMMSVDSSKYDLELLSGKQSYSKKLEKAISRNAEILNRRFPKTNHCTNWKQRNVK